MTRYSRGDLAAFTQLYERHKASLYRYLLRLTRDRAVAEDLFQEVWSRVIASRERYEPRAKFSTFPVLDRPQLLHRSLPAQRQCAGRYAPIHWKAPRKARGFIPSGPGTFGGKCADCGAISCRTRTPARRATRSVSAARGDAGSTWMKSRGSPVSAWKRRKAACGMPCQTSPESCGRRPALWTARRRWRARRGTDGELK